MHYATARVGKNAKLAVYSRPLKKNTQAGFAFFQEPINIDGVVYTGSAEGRFWDFQLAGLLAVGPPAGNPKIFLLLTPYIPPTPASI